MAAGSALTRTRLMLMSHHLTWFHKVFRMKSLPQMTAAALSKVENPSALAAALKTITLLDKSRVLVRPRTAQTVEKT